MNKWSKTQLGQIAQVIDSLHKTPNYSDEGYPMVRVTDVVQGFLKTENCLKVSNEVFHEFSKKHRPKKGDIIFSRVGSEGRTSLVVEDINFCLGQNTAFISPHNNNYFLYYWLNSSSGLAQIKKKTTGASQRTISLKSIKEIEIFLPSKDEQEELSRMIFRYDFLIENNQKRIKILEEMAQRLYTEWFVKFKFPGYENVKMVDSGTEFGEIPEGWEIRKLGEIAEFINGFAFKPSHLGNTGFPIIKIPELRSGVKDDTPRNCGEKIDKKYFIHRGDLLFSWSASLLVGYWKDEKGLLNQHLFKVKPKEKKYTYLNYFFIRSLINESSDHVVGSTMKHLRRGDVIQYRVLTASHNISEKFEQIVANYYSMIEKLDNQNQQQFELRELLINNLITGKRLQKNSTVAKSQK